MTLRLMLNTRASEPGTMTSLSNRLGTLTRRSSPGLASVGLKLILFTVRSAFMAPRTFSECEGSRLGGTAMVYNVFSKIIFILVMAEGGYDPRDETTDKDPLITKKGDDDDDDGDPWDKTDWSKIPAWTEPDPDRTQPFTPGDASTPAGGESIPMTTRTSFPQERGNLIDETSFGGEPTERMAWNEIKWEFEMADESQLKARWKTAPKSGGAIIEVSMRKKDTWYPLFTKSRGDVAKSFNESLPKEIQKALGKSLDEQFNDTNTALKEKQNELDEKQKQLEQKEQRAAESQKLMHEMDALTNQIRDKDDRMRELEDKHGSSLNEEAIQRLKDEKKTLEGEKRSKDKELAQLRKLAKQDDKIRAEVDKLVRERRELETRKNELEAKKNALKPLDELKQQAEELETRITEDKRVIEDENTSSSERAAAEARIAENEAELERVNTEIEVRERQRPLLERVKDIFKKYGWTLQAVVLAVGLVLSALALAGLNGLKAGTKALGNGLKAIGQKLGSLLPGLIGSIVSYIFKAAGSVLSFLGEHAWLLILAVVAFFMERLLKKRRR